MGVYCNLSDFCSIVESGSENEDEWEEVEEEQDSSIICLFCEECFRNAENVWDHCVSAHKIDLLKIKRIHSKSIKIEENIDGKLCHLSLSVNAIRSV